MRSLFYRWTEAHQWAGDALLAIAFLLVLVINSRYLYEPEALPVQVLVAVPLFVRRSRPELALGHAIAVLLLHLYALAEVSVGVALAPIIVFSTVSHARLPFWGRLALAVGLLGAVLGPLRWGYVHVDDLTVAAMAGGLCAVTVIAAYVLGERQRDLRERQAEQLAAMADRAVLLAAERDQLAAVAAATQRARIARELHDIVAHSLSMLHTIADTSREALAELRRLVGVLRSDPAAATAAVWPGSVPGRRPTR